MGGIGKKLQYFWNFDGQISSVAPSMCNTIYSYFVGGDTAVLLMSNHILIFANQDIPPSARSSPFISPCRVC